MKDIEIKDNENYALNQREGKTQIKMHKKFLENKGNRRKELSNLLYFIQTQIISSYPSTNAAFTFFDIFKRSHIDLECFKKGLISLGLNITDVQMEAAFKFLDIDNNKVITHKEFTTLVNFKYFDKLDYDNYLDDSIDMIKSKSNVYILGETNK